MLLFTLQRMLQSIAVLLAVSVAVFLAVYAVGDPVELLVNPEATQLEREAMVSRLGLDQPVWMQYFTFLSNAVQGDMGTSFVHAEPALQLILSRMPATFELVFLAMLVASIIGIPLGLYVGLKEENRIARAIMTGSIFGYSIPSFWKGMVLILFFAVWLQWLPASGRGETVSVFGIPFSFLTVDGLRHLAMPVINLAIPNIALITRLTAAGASEARMQDYVKFARAKGVREKRIVRRHILRNILIPIITVLGVEFGSLIAFSTITETVFAWPGMGKLLITSIYQLDRPVVVAYVMLVTFIFVVVNLLVDFTYALLDPRVSLSERMS
ncbi:ABC transporter permease [Nitratireductor aquimarinus]|uniref:ABC transporter permease n=1 Tax=Nitratireductor aquimarinus TaxID=889300 RepID=A0ABU4AHB4_9HYPH|nr:MULTISPECIES: ABC transporter permease [Alphaproteobacteria]MBN7762154.1 ABC transporter permease [Nitratireductor aquibiodomus]MBN7775419.1 ABC transporter permease [Nitratireductor pacificus]MBY6021433.1 ABC transporter permease [Nitratireductor sp. DP7N14-4]MBN7756976.1 ABC transporter permease [Nitratireductor aquimarinus]MBN7781433.1 ABC transporter permease [Nitratireductor pacificus]